jgi:hypothetical protein
MSVVTSILERHQEPCDTAEQPDGNPDPECPTVSQGDVGSRFQTDP